MIKSLSILVVLLASFLGNNFLFAKPSTCKKLRENRKACLSGVETKVIVVCGHRYYRYWVNDYERLEGTELEIEYNNNMCVYVKEEIFEMSCNDFINYRVPSMFCRRQKKKICRSLKQDGFGLDQALKWPKKKKRRVKGYKGKVIDKNDGYLRVSCDEIKRK